MNAQGSGEISDNALTELLMHSVPAAVMGIDAQRVVRLWKGKAHEILGHSEESIVGKPFEVVCKARLSLEPAKPLSAPLPFRHSDDSTRWLRLTLSPTDEFGACGALLVGIDVSEYVRQQSELERTTEFLDLVSRLTRAGAWGFDLASGERFFSPETMRIYGFPEDHNPTLAEGINQYPEHARDIVTRAFNEAIEFQRPYDVQVDFVARDGAPLVIRTTGVPRVVDGEVKWVSGVFQDVTAPREQQASMREVQRRETLGRLVGSVVHDFNNLLCVVLGATEYAALESRDPEVVESELRAIEEATRRGAKLTKKLLELGRQASSTVRPIDVRRAAENVCEMLARLMNPHGVALTVECDETPSAVAISPVDLDQVLLNLVGNAKDAMPKGGNVLVRVRHEATAGNRDEADPGWVSISVSDDGPGVPQDVRATLFERFVSTKGANGYGLGLATVREIVQAMGGSVQLEGEGPLPGAHFVVRLPCIESRLLGSESERPRKPAAVVSGGETIVVLEDNDHMGKALARGLDRYGYRTSSFADRDAALLHVQSGAGADVLVVSTNTPGFSDAKRASELVRQGSIKGVVFVSSYPEHFDTMPGTPWPVLAKPFRPRRLAMAVRSALAVCP